MSAKYEVGIIGYGDFAKLMVDHLWPHADIVVASRHPGKDSTKCRFVSNEEALDREIIIPAIPAQFLESYFKTYHKSINPHALVIDVCSVKVKPIEVLKGVLPPSVEILATHPLFGPASAQNGLRGLKILLHPTRLEAARYHRIKSFVTRKLGLKVIEATPEEHDRVMAYAQGLSHYIGRIMQIMDIPESELTTRAYDDLLDMKRIQGNDSWELFESIMEENPYAREVNQAFKKACAELDKKLGL